MITNITNRDHEALSNIIHLHAVSDPLVLDCTHNKGVIWRGVSKPHRLIRSDRCNYAPSEWEMPPFSIHQDTICDFMQMPYAEQTFDMIVFDPPHLPTVAASANSSNKYRERYGVTNNGLGREGENVSGMFAPAIAEFSRVLKQGGIFATKIIDLTHNHRKHWQHVDLINTAQSMGFEVVDLFIKIPPSPPMISSKWVNQYHSRNAFSYWVVAQLPIPKKTRASTKSCAPQNATEVENES